MEFDLNIPGAFIEHTPLQPTLTRTTALSHLSSRSIYRTPQATTAASSLSKSFRAPRPGSELGSYTGSRKRQRLDIAAATATPDSSASRGYFSHSNYDMLDASIEARSPAPLVNIDYHIAGGIDTPHVAQEDEDRDAALDYRMNRFTIASSPQQQYNMSHNPQTPGPLAREANGRKRTLSSQDSPQRTYINSWTIPRTVWALTGGVALKVASFAWSTGKAFTGFRAVGGGTTYQYTPGGFADQSWSAVVEENGPDPFDDDAVAAQRIRRRRRDGYNGEVVPGDFPTNGAEGDGSNIDTRYIDNYMDDPSAYHHQRRREGNVETPTLRGGTGKDGPSSTSTLRSPQGNARDSWVLIDPQDVTSRETSPTRRHKVPHSAHHHRSRASIAGTGMSAGARVKLQPRSSTASTTTGASYASPRAGGAAASSLSNPPTSPSRPSFSPAGHRRSRSSIASPRRDSAFGSAPMGGIHPPPSYNCSLKTSTPASPEVIAYTRKLRTKDAKIDRSMRRVNTQLEEMIREGREALGTRVEVRDYEGDGNGGNGRAGGGRMCSAGGRSIYEVDRVDGGDFREEGDGYEEEEDEGYAGSDGLRY